MKDEGYQPPRYVTDTRPTSQSDRDVDWRPAGEFLPRFARGIDTTLVAAHT
jgi:hypothetical protein